MNIVTKALIPVAIALMSFSMPVGAEVSDEKYTDLYRRYEKNIFPIERITAPVVMSGRCYHVREGGIDYMVALIYPYEGGLFLYGRVSFYGIGDYGHWSAEDAVTSFIAPDQHPGKKSSRRKAGIIKEGGSIQWAYQFNAFAMVQESGEKFIANYRTANSATPISFCDLKVHP